MVYYPSFPDFQQIAQKANVIPVYRQLLADTLTPVSAFQRLNVTGHGLLLESVTGGERIGRFSFLASEPVAIIRVRRDEVEITRGDQSKTYKSDDPLGELQEFLAHTHPAVVPGLETFTGGIVGYLAYDVVRYIEDLPSAPTDDLGLPDIYMLACETLVVFDHVFKTIRVVHNARLGGRSAREAYDEAVARIDEVVEKLRSPHLELRALGLRGRRATLPGVYPRGRHHPGRPLPATGRRDQRRPLRCLSHPQGHQPIALYVLPAARRSDACRRLPRGHGQTRLRLGDLTLVGASPEVMVKLEGEKITVRPIAGTRPRGKTPEEDEALAEELLADPKERAEHVMLLDLGRNDVGRVARYGSVVVDEKMIVERYSHVMHITSNVTGRLAPGRNAFDVLRACLPAGTVSGAPKVRAMQIIDELEPTRRGPYAGAVGSIDFHGNVNTCITLRTIVFHGGKAYVQAGAGIVADSVPEREYQECINKAKALLRAIEVAEGQLTANRNS